MKITYCFKVRNLALAAALSADLGFMSPSFGQFVASWIMDSEGKGLTQLGALGGQYTDARDINAAGQVVGYSQNHFDDTHDAFITGPNGEGMTDLNSLVSLPPGVVLTQAYGINNLGQVVVVGTIMH